MTPESELIEALRGARDTLLAVRMWCADPASAEFQDVHIAVIERMLAMESILARYRAP